MNCSSRGVSRRRLLLSAAAAAALGSVVTAGPAAADWPAPQQGFSIASVGVSGTCVSAVGGVVGLKSCAQPVGADQTWVAIDGTYASRLRNAATGQCVLSWDFQGVDCSDSRLSVQRWRYVLMKGYADRGVIHQRQSGRGPLSCWQAFTGGGSSGDGLVGGIRRNSECDSIKGDLLPAVNMWTLAPVG
ncbi:hypothetical protein [Nocardia transvalensis]|uniref:hypothetical protein n=1 Tax=Nocardia transvalensis TaxID=37333 RepID=UPI001892EC53|nr:hypothetical protein [Nocardia transvalensis]MBF6334123.1 hypothetical protein [Nocardia transvalensis]